MIDRDVVLKELSSFLNFNVGGDAVNPLGSTIDPLMSRQERIAHFRAAWQLYNIHRKRSDGTVSAEMRHNGFNNFLGLQGDLKKINRRVHLEALIPKVRSIISEVLPPLSFVEEDLWPLCTFGPGTFHGAVKALRGTGYSLHYKVGGDQTVTTTAWTVAKEVIPRYFPNWLKLLKKQSSLSFVRGNRVSYVPKDNTKARQISIEPSLNVFLQQGVGRWMARHFREVGFADLYHGQSRNAQLAGDLRNATIDLSNASDMISNELVRQLLPGDWYQLLNRIRSHHWQFGHERGTYENFSSQGNAFTFPLETLIFKATVMAATELSRREVTVYGDDIIVPVSAFQVACEALEAFGFVVNTQKSYGGQHDENTFAFAFRESCGADYYEGEEVTPVYYREDARSYSDVAVLYNRLLETWGLLPRLHAYLLSLVPTNRRCFGPRFFITGDPNIYERAHSKTLSIGLNKLVSNVSLYFWSDDGFNNRYYSSKGKKIKKRDIISEETQYYTFLLGDDGSVPRSSIPIISKGSFYEAPKSIIEKSDACTRGSLEETPVWTIGLKTRMGG